MFNGIIKNTGKIYKIITNNNNCIIEIFSKIPIKKSEIGSSISCSGACLTLESFKKNLIKFYISKETLNKTNFKYAKKNDIINIEKSLKYGQRLSGHFVQGHVDTTAKIKKITVIGKSWVVDFKLQKSFFKLLISKGSITINGISLTIAKINEDGFKIAIIPQTLKSTNLLFVRKNDIVNVEFDVLGKYI